MIYVEMLGRMGNQMFSYAFARYLQLKYKKGNIAFDFSNFQFDDRDMNSLCHYKCWENIEFKEREMSIVQRLLLKLYFKRRNRKKYNEVEVWQLETKWQDILSIFGIYICSFNYHNFKFRPLTKNLLCIGFFESPKFFSDIEDFIKDEFRMDDNSLSEAGKALSRDISATKNSVCIGIRRGDFESKSNKKQCSVCDVAYYEKAIKKMEERIENPHFFFFTDNPEWVKDNVASERDVVVGDEEIVFDEKLYIMSKCNHFILSNSTYIWWAQHLSNSINKIVIAPSKWRNLTPETHQDIYEEGWHILSVDNLKEIN